MYFNRDFLRRVIITPVKTKAYRGFSKPLRSSKWFFNKPPESFTFTPIYTILFRIIFHMLTKPKTLKASNLHLWIGKIFRVRISSSQTNFSLRYSIGKGFICTSQFSNFSRPESLIRLTDKAMFIFRFIFHMCDAFESSCLEDLVRMVYVLRVHDDNFEGLRLLRRLMIASI